MTHITLVKPSNRCNIWPNDVEYLNNKQRSSDNHTRKTFMVCVSPVLLLDLCFPLLLSHSLRRVCYFFTPFMRPSFLSKLSRFRTHTKTLNPYTLTKLSHHSHQNYKKTPLPHPHPMSHLRHQVCVSGQRVLTKHFRFEFVTSPNAILLCHIIVTSTASNVC